MLLVALAFALVTAHGALAKGPIEATISGPGLATPIQVGDWSNWGEEEALAAHQPIMQLAEAAGFFPATFGEPGAMSDSRPAGPLGPRYAVRYGVPGPDNDEFEIVQDMYPYAKPSPVTYTPPGQPIFERPGGTAGGWFVADDPRLPALLPVLLDAGLPAAPPGATSEDEPFPWSILLVSLLLAGALAGAIAVGLRRRHQPAAT